MGGDSRIIDPLGVIIAKAQPDAVTTLFADIDAAHVADVRARFPFLAERGE